MLAAPGREGLPGHHDHRPGREARPGLRGLRPGASSATCFCRTEGGDIYIGQVWPGNTAFPDFVDARRRARGGASSTPRTCESGLAGIWNDMNEPATGEHPAAARCASTTAAYSHERYHNQYALLMAMGTTAGPARGDARTGGRSSCRAPGSPASSATPRTGWATTSPRWDHLWLSIPMAMRLRPVGPAVRRRRHRRLPGRHQRRAVPALDAVRHADAVLPQPLRDRQRRPVRLVVGRRRSSDLVREAIAAALPAAALHLRGVPARAAETGAPVQRPLVFDHQDDPAVRDLDDEYLFGPRPARRARVRAGQTRARSTCPRATGTTGTPASAIAGRPVSWSRRRRWTASRSSPAAGAVDPDVAARRRPRPPATTRTAIELHLFVPAADGTHRSFLQEDDGLTFAARSGGRASRSPARACARPARGRSRAPAGRSSPAAARFTSTLPEYPARRPPRRRRRCGGRRRRRSWPGTSAPSCETGSSGRRG